MGYICSIAMKELFNIQSGKKEPGNECLSMRIGDHHCSYAVTSSDGAELYELAFCSVPLMNENELSAFRSLYPRISEPYRKVQVSFDFSRATLVPSVYYRPEYNRGLLGTLHGDAWGAHILSDQVTAWQICNVYSLPLDVHDWVNQQYPAVSLRHQYSLWLKSIPASADGVILADFRPSEFSVMAATGSRLLVAQTYEYETPADVLYHLLRICRQFGLDPSVVNLRISGLIVRHSALHFDLEQYFRKLELRDASWKEADSTYPSHFFTALNDLAICAS
jgi:hypothetical protein